MLHPTRTNKRGFTLIELLVVISIISILAAILFPVFARARENARKTACLSNAKQIGMGLMMYAQDYDEKLPLYYFTGGVSYAWHHPVVPYIKSEQVFICPSASPAEVWWCGPTHIRSSGSGSFGYNWYLGEATAISLASVQVPAQTIAIAEITQFMDTSVFYVPTQWAAAKTKLCGSGTTRGDQAAFRHFDGNNSIFMDGHVKWMKKSALADFNRDGAIDNGWFTLTKS